MTDVANGATTGVTIDRLILDLPGMDAVAARELALGIAEGLAGAGLDADHAGLSVTVDPAVAAQPQRLAAHIVQTLLQRIG
ncbi:hypothetical protein [Novosphingobium lentum]|uniref:hypothetical protein n=1 Tax=Novosphingobium lentum TaxID=145287 RepID=UPI0008367F3F|nr:hypothetical protein [Novosphingobium lentum]